MENYQSLYDYLGRPGGSDLGQKIAAYSKHRSIQPQTRVLEGMNISVLTYPTSFLKEYFDAKERWEQAKIYFS